MQIHSTTCNSNQKQNNDKCQCDCKKDYSWNPSTCICENAKYLPSIANDSKIVCQEIINAANSVSINVSINFHNKKVRYKMHFYILNTVLLVNILLFIIAIICYHYAKQR